MTAYIEKRMDSYDHKNINVKECKQSRTIIILFARQDASSAPEAIGAHML